MATNAHATQEAVEQEDVAIDVGANDLVHIGVDDQGDAHYYDAQRDRVVVSDATHEEYTRDGSSVVRRSLVANAADVEEIVTGVDGRLRAYIQHVDVRVDDRDWESIMVRFIDVDELLADVEEGI